MKRRLISLIMVLALLSCTLPAQAATGTLRKGSKGSVVSQLQTAVRRLRADGIAGPKTLGKLYGSTGNEAADASAQADSAAAASASSGKSATGSLKQGSSGDRVKDLQTKLWYTGYYTGSISGSFDAVTHTAVTAFQKAKGLTRDGIAGKKTLTALDTAWNEARAAAVG